MEARLFKSNQLFVILILATLSLVRRSHGVGSISRTENIYGENQIPGRRLVASSQNSSSITCAARNNKKVNFPVQNGEYFVKNCQSCYTLWRYFQDNHDKPFVMEQGCWPEPEECSQTECVVSNENNVGKTFKDKSFNFCCCRGNMCNQKFLTSHEKGDESQFSTVCLSSALGFVSVVLLLSLCLGVGCFCRRQRYFAPGDENLKKLKMSNNMKKVSSEEALTDEDEHPLLSLSTTSFFKQCPDISTLTLSSVVRNGKFSVVYRAKIDGLNHEVAVKTFSKTKRNNFLKELSVYEASHYSSNNNNNNDALLKFFGAQENACIDGVKYDCLFVMSLAEHGSLENYLKANTLDWQHLCNMSKGISQGLAYIHSENNFKTKAFSHGNLNPHHILVTGDLKCQICDFSKSTSLTKTKLGHSDLQDDDVSVRYLAPEILSRTVNKDDLANVLKQCDVYAMGLVFWEMATRCHVLYQGAEVPSYAPAYEKEVKATSKIQEDGKVEDAPCWDQMANLVSMNKARPLFPSVWKKTNPGVQLLKETIEYCWDGDGEARLTPLGVVERIGEMDKSWVRYHNEKRKNNCDHQTTRMSKNGFVSPLTNHNDISSTSQDQHVHPKTGIEDHRLNEKNSLTNQKLVPKLQPHQGRNPCLERNLAPPTSESHQQYIRSTATSLQQINQNLLGSPVISPIEEERQRRPDENEHHHHPRSMTMTSTRILNPIHFVPNDLTLQVSHISEISVARRKSKKNVNKNGIMQRNKNINVNLADNSGSQNLVANEHFMQNQSTAALSVQ